MCPGIGFPLALLDDLIFGMKIPGICFSSTLMSPLWVLLLPWRMLRLWRRLLPWLLLLPRLILCCGERCRRGCH